MEKRGNDFFDEMMRLGRIPDLMRAKRVERAFEQEVVADTPQQIEHRVSELVDWMVEQDLRQWTAVADHMAKRKEDHDNRIVGEGGPREGTLAYDRQRLIDSIGAATHRAVESYDKEQRSGANGRIGPAGRGQHRIGGVGVGLGVAIAIAAHVVWVDVTGILAGIAAATIGLLILPARRRKAKARTGREAGRPAPQAGEQPDGAV